MISMIGITYMWGMPLIDKQKDVVKISNSESFMKELDDKIQDVIKNGGTRRITNPDFTGTLTLTDSGIDDVFLLKLETTGTDIATGTNIYLRGDSRNEVVIGEEPGTLKVLSVETSENKYDVTTELYYRNITSSNKKYIIDLVGLGRGSITSGEHNIIISEGDSPSIPVIESGTEIYKTVINVRIE